MDLCTNMNKYKYVFDFRLGISNREASMDPEDEVNEFLSRAIDARSVERWKKEHVRPVILKFRKKEYEKKVCFFNPAS